MQDTLPAFSRRGRKKKKKNKKMFIRLSALWRSQDAVVLPAAVRAMCNARDLPLFGFLCLHRGGESGDTWKGDLWLIVRNTTRPTSSTAFFVYVFTSARAALAEDVSLQLTENRWGDLCCRANRQTCQQCKIYRRLVGFQPFYRESLFFMHSYTIT